MAASISNFTLQRHDTPSDDTSSSSRSGVKSQYRLELEASFAGAGYRGVQRRQSTTSNLAIMEWSSCTELWQCKTNLPVFLGFCVFFLTVCPGLSMTISLYVPAGRSPMTSKFLLKI